MSLGNNVALDMTAATTTPKYAPVVNELIARSPGIAELHPDQPDGSVQGLLRLLWELGRCLEALSGMDEFTLQGLGGAHAIFAGVLDDQGVPREPRRRRAGRDHQHVRLSPDQPRDRRRGRIQGGRDRARAARVRRGRRGQGGRVGADGRPARQQPGGHGGLQPRHRQARRGRPRRRRPLRLRPGERERHSRHLAGPRLRLRPLPVQPPQDVRRADLALRPRRRSTRRDAPSWHGFSRFR